ncbi:diadenylate cyclase CdaA [Aequorivita echinoideorum]|uniref:Diadenylate cyclase n=1 Tax=Aequorivita echinoideorum TaxID=1549647 RepID=A0ABS5S776_9FLAO|nr:diadenylate cyclase CdaA [Aequorivita echinoideorum]MBT0609061.1 diadenylate cyclase CdaA [Aequorivita echinoideorum]
MDFLDIRIIDIVDIVLVAFLLYYLYNLVKGTVAINILVGIIIVYAIYVVTQLLEMELLSKILGGFLGVGMFALVVVFQPEIRKFLLMLGSTNFNARRRFFKQFKMLGKDNGPKINIEGILSACRKMSESNTGALIVIQRNNSLDFVKNSGDEMNLQVNQPIIESVFFKNSPLHDGAMIIEENRITATRVILPVSNDRKIPLRFGLRHRAAVGITEKTDAVCLVVSEENGQISYLKDGDFVLYDNLEELHKILEADLS